MKIQYITIILIVLFSTLGCNKEIIVSSKTTKSKTTKFNSIAVYLNQKIILKSKASQLKVIFQNVSISHTNNRCSVTINYKWELIENNKRNFGKEKSLIVYKKEKTHFTKPKYFLKKIKGTQNIQYGIFHIKWSYRNRKSIWLQLPTGYTVSSQGGSGTPMILQL